MVADWMLNIENESREASKILYRQVATCPYDDFPRVRCIVESREASRLYLASDFGDFSRAVVRVQDTYDNFTFAPVANRRFRRV